MLPTDLLSYRHNGEEIIPKRLSIDDRNLTIATEIITCYEDTVGNTQGLL